MLHKLLILFSLCLVCYSIQAQDLVRRAFLGIQLTTVSDSLNNIAGLEAGSGVLVQRVFPNSSASAAGLQSGDLIFRLDKKNIRGVADFLAILKQYQTGDEVMLGLWRNGKTLRQSLILKAMPKEEYEGASIEYGSVPGPDGPLRSILTIPANRQKNAPVVYIIQGIDCSSIELAFAPQSAFRQLIESCHTRGYATFRVEKSGVGDSKGKACRDCDFMEDANGFLNGLKNLKTHVQIDSGRIFLLGLSMGGVWAPWMASQESVKGIIAYGTISRPFQEYLLENFRRQAILGGTDYGELETSMKNDARLYHYLFEEHLSPDQVMTQHPDLANRIRQISTERGEGPIEHLFAQRTYQFHAQLQNLNVAECWSKVDASVLAVWGKGDYVSNRADHTLIRDMVNYYHPGKASFKEVEANHWFETSSSMEEAFASRQRNDNPPFNQAVFDLFLDWITKHS